MKQFHIILFFVFVLASCTTNKDYLSRTDEDKALFDAVKVLVKHNNDTEATAALPVLYSHAQQRHLKIIEGYQSHDAINRWDQIIAEYNVLQKMYDAIAATEAINQLVKPVNYQSTIYDLKQQAAEAYYNEANTYLAKQGRDDARKAYSYFKKSDKWVPGYKDAKAKMDIAYQNAIVVIVINEIKDNSYYFNTGWSNAYMDYNNQKFMRNLVRELGGSNATRYPAKFYTDQEARQANIDPNLAVNLILRNLEMPAPLTYTNSYRRSQSVEIGRDTSGHSIYQNVYATIYAERISYTARAEMELNIIDAGTKKNIVYNTYRESYNWEVKRGYYEGDSRALTSEDWSNINSNGNNDPGKDEILNYLYDRIYPQVKSRISQVAEW